MDILCNVIYANSTIHNTLRKIVVKDILGAGYVVDGKGIEEFITKKIPDKINGVIYYGVWVYEEEHGQILIDVMAGGEPNVTTQVLIEKENILYKKYACPRCVPYYISGYYFNVPPQPPIIPPAPEYNFDITFIEELMPFSNQETFETWLVGLGGSAISIQDFSIDGNRVTANVNWECESISLENLSDFYRVGNVSGCTSLTIISSSLGNINDAIYPSTLQVLFLEDCGLDVFNPSVALPSSLTMLSLSNNNLATISTTLPLPLLTSLTADTNNLSNFNTAIPLPSTLQTINLSYNNINTLSSTYPLPDSITAMILVNNQISSIPLSFGDLPNIANIFLDSNSFTNVGYASSEAWANSLSNRVNYTEISFDGNINDVCTTDFKTILDSKGVSVVPCSVSYNFDMTFIDHTEFFTDQTTFEAWWSGTVGGTVLSIADFSIIGERVVCNMTSGGTSLAFERLTSVSKFSNISYSHITIDNSNINNFDDTIFPIGLVTLAIGNSNVVSFNPANPLPPNLLSLYLANNNINEIGVLNPLPNSLTYLYLANNQISQIPTTIGQLPNIEFIDLEFNAFNTSASYTNSESWANSLSFRATSPYIGLSNNTEDVCPSDFKTIMQGKGFIVSFCT